MDVKTFSRFYSFHVFDVFLIFGMFYCQKCNVSQYIILMTLCVVCTTIFNIEGQCNVVKMITQETQIVMQYCYAECDDILHRQNALNCLSRLRKFFLKFFRQRFFHLRF